MDRYRRRRPRVPGDSEAKQTREGQPVVVQAGDPDRSYLRTFQQDEYNQPQVKHLAGQRGRYRLSNFMGIIGKPMADLFVDKDSGKKDVTVTLSWRGSGLTLPTSSRRLGNSFRITGISSMKRVWCRCYYVPAALIAR